MTMPSRRWSGAMNSSRREKTSFAGRFALRATAATCASKWNSHLPPKPPPRWGDDHTDLVLGHLQRVRDTGAGVERHLR
jgi:hypothetical protein